jgi:hypothetical protein
MKTYRGLEIKLHSRPRQQMEVSGQPQAPTALPTGIGPRYPLDTRLDGSQSRSGHCGEEKNFLPLPRNEPRPSNP